MRLANVAPTERKRPAYVEEDAFMQMRLGQRLSREFGSATYENSRVVHIAAVLFIKLLIVLLRLSFMHVPETRLIVCSLARENG